MTEAWEKAIRLDRRLGSATETALAAWRRNDATRTDVNRMMAYAHHRFVVRFALVADMAWTAACMEEETA